MFAKSSKQQSNSQLETKMIFDFHQFLLIHIRFITITEVYNFGI